MERSVIALITAYQRAVARAVDELKASGIPQPQSNVGWALNGIPNIGALTAGGTYRKHGYGCTVETSAGEVDFDFGSRGEVDGFDAWRLWLFADARREAFGVLGEAQIRESLEVAHERGELRRERNGGLYYFNGVPSG
jgi:uncharacterized protein DUF6896